MEEPEYTEGPKALKNFERGMNALFKVPKTAVIVQARKKKQKPSSVLKAMQTWKLLESALLDTFWDRYFGLPKYDKVRPKPKDGLFRYDSACEIDKRI
jgi:hypothetical protein